MRPARLLAAPARRPFEFKGWLEVAREVLLAAPARLLAVPSAAARNAQRSCSQCPARRLGENICARMRIAALRLRSRGGLRVLGNHFACNETHRCSRVARATSCIEKVFRAIRCASIGALCMRACEVLPRRGEACRDRANRIVRCGTAQRSEPRECNVAHGSNNSIRVRAESPRSRSRPSASASGAERWTRNPSYCAAAAGVRRSNGQRGAGIGYAGLANR
jgi:hypothetical protein